MRELACKGSGHPVVIEAAQEAVRRAPERDDVATMDALLQDVRRRMRYTPDPLGTELVKAPWVAVEKSQDDPEPMDCDDASCLLSSMLGAVGIKSKYVVVAANRSRPREFSHVYVKALDGKTGRWLALDPIMRDWSVGQEVPAQRVTRREEYPAMGGLSMLNNGDATRRMGLGCYRGCSIRNGVSGLGSVRGLGFASTASNPDVYSVEEYVNRKLTAAEAALVKSTRAAGGDIFDLADSGFRPVGGGGAASAGGGFVNEWLNPFYATPSIAVGIGPVTGIGAIRNLKAVAVLAGLGFIATKLLKKRRR